MSYDEGCLNGDITALSQIFKMFVKGTVESRFPSVENVPPALPKSTYTTFVTCGLTDIFDVGVLR